MEIIEEDNKIHYKKQEKNNNSYNRNNNLYIGNY